MRQATAIIIGAGQAGLAMSKRLTDRSIDHVLLERGTVANSWRTERWDSLRLLTPNWQSRLPSFEYSGSDPDGYMTMPDVNSFLGQYARTIDAPVMSNTTVTAVRPAEIGYTVTTDQGDWYSPNVVLASGACNVATMPAIAQEVPTSVKTVTPMQYKNPDQLEDGGVMVVGASATGVQLAREIQASGRQVTLAVGEHVRMPRMYRGRDIKWWMDVTGTLDTRYDAVDDLPRARRVPSLQLVGSPDRESLDLNTLQQTGVELVGRCAGMRDGRMLFSGSLANQCALADLKMNRLLDSIDQWIGEHAPHAVFGPAERPEPTVINDEPKLDMDLTDGSIRTIIWATGYRPDYSWLHVPVLNRKGRIRHDGGVTEAPGLYVLGLPFLRRRKSSLIDGVGDDARDLADHLAFGVHRKAA
ncbi:MAG: NAD(P)-binding domain-containing protein [Alphaproteobacteria bacterium]|nr:NAD(P)-binding domain-containing protein [Alphaproteobacteria bacterium]